MRAIVRLAAAFTRAWVLIYTAGMPDDLRTRRRAEIESDVWEHQNDATEAGVTPLALAGEILARTLQGAIDDVVWRFEVNRERRRACQEGRTDMARSKASWTAVGGIIGGVLWASNLPLILLVPDLYRQGRPLIVVARSLAPILVAIGLVGTYAQWRRHAKRSAVAGCVVLCVSYIIWVAVTLGARALGVDLKTAHVNVYGLWEFPPVAGFFLIALGTRGWVRMTSGAAGGVGLLSAIAPAAIPIVRMGDVAFMPLALAFLFLAGIGVALIGYDAFRHSNPAAA